jgi:hypothetical protein
MKIKFTTPVVVGDMQRRIEVASMEVITVAFNLAPEANDGTIIASITLRDKSTGYQVHHVYQDDTETLDLWTQVKPLEIDGEEWLTHLMRRLIADGKLPQGELSSE